MHSYARTNIQLFNQLRQEGYSNTDLRSVRDAYELAMVLFTGRFQPSGRPFVTHVVGTASILASLRLPAPVTLRVQGCARASAVSWPELRVLAAKRPKSTLQRS